MCATNVVLLFLAIPALVQGGGSDGTILPQQNWTQTSQGKTSVPNRDFQSPTGTQYSSGNVGRYNILPMAGPVGAFYRGPVDKSAYRPSGFLTGKHVQQGLGYMSRLPTSVVQDPLQSRFGGINLPPVGSAGYRFLGDLTTIQNSGFFNTKNPTVGIQNTGFFMNKIPVGQNFPLLHPQQMRGSRVVVDNISYKQRDPTKKTGVYVVPSPSKLYYDGVKN